MNTYWHVCMFTNGNINVNMVSFRISNSYFDEKRSEKIIPDLRNHLYNENPVDMPNNDSSGNWN